jgi:DNA-binding XRE family transcriptional regulator
VTGPPTVVVPPVERYVTRSELARTMGVSESTIKRLDKDGMPSETWGMKRTRRYLPSACVAWARGRPMMRASRDRDDTAPEQRQPKE